MTSTTTTCDALGRRIARHEYGVRTAGWLYLDSLRPVAELNAANEVTSVFIYGGDAHAPSVMRRGGESGRELDWGCPGLNISREVGCP